MILTRQQVDEMIALYETSKTAEPGAPTFTLPVGDVLETMKALHDIVHKVRRWGKASPGKDAVDAEFEMMNSVDALKGETDD